MGEVRNGSALPAGTFFACTGVMVSPRKINRMWILAIAMVATTGCGDDYQSPLSIVAENYKAELGLELADCGDNAECDDDVSTFGCMSEAFESCTPSEARGCLRYDVVHPSAGGECLFVVFLARHEKECEWDCSNITIVEEYRCNHPQPDDAYGGSDCDLIAEYEYWH